MEDGQKSEENNPWPTLVSCFIKHSSGVSTSLHQFSCIYAFTFHAYRWENSRKTIFISTLLNISKLNTCIFLH